MGLDGPALEVRAEGTRGPAPVRGSEPARRTPGRSRPQPMRRPGGPSPWDLRRGPRSLRAPQGPGLSRMSRGEWASPSVRRPPRTRTPPASELDRAPPLASSPCRSAGPPPVTDAQAGRPLLELFLCPGRQAPRPPGSRGWRAGGQSGRHAEPRRPGGPPRPGPRPRARPRVSQPRGGGSRRRRRPPRQLAPPPGAAEPGAVLGGGRAGPGAQPAAGAAERHPVPRGGHRHHLLVGLVGAAVLRDCGR